MNFGQHDSCSGRHDFRRLLLFFTALLNEQFSSYQRLTLKRTAIFEPLFNFIFAQVSGRKHFTSQHLTSLFLAIVTFLQD